MKGDTLDRTQLVSLVKRLDEVEVSERNRALIKMVADGGSYSDAAAKYGISSSRARELIIKFIKRIKMCDLYRVRVKSRIDKIDSTDCSIQTKRLVSLFAADDTYVKISEETGIDVGHIILAIKTFLYKSDESYEKRKKWSLEAAMCVQKKRLELGFTLAQVAEQSGLNKQTLMRYEVKFPLNPSFYDVKALADVLGIPVESLFPPLESQRMQKIAG